MAKTVTSLFSSEAQASSIVGRLENAGFGHDKICLFSNTGTNRYWGGTSGLHEGSRAAADDRGDHVAEYLRDNGVPAMDAHAYAEGVRRGNALVAVRCDDDEVNKVVSILDQDDVLDIDEQQATWASEGWMGYGAGMAGTADSATVPSVGKRSGSEMRGSDMQSRDRDEVIPVAEEELHVGKREVSHGRVRIVSHVVERPVQEQVSLREEHVQVERRPVEGSRRMGDGDLFRERSIEMEERAEEPVISKEARVTEEIAVRKDVDRRNETVSDKVRKTEVEVEDERGNRISKTGTRDDKR